MLTSDQILESAKSTLIIESKSITRVISELNHYFIEAVQLISKSNGRVIVTGIGKSANIGQKMVATFNSTGTPAIFMHAADAIHGDLGIVQKDDVVICISNSGNTPEIKYLLPLLKRGGTKIIALTGSRSSSLWEQADFPIYAGVEQEACPNNLAPTSSTTVQLALGDALAVTLLKMKGFTENDFAKYHPGGALGKKLYLTLGEICSTKGELSVSSTAHVKDIIVAISENRLGAVVVLENHSIVGIITDGDIRRMLEQRDDFLSLKAINIMSGSPKTLKSSELAVEGLKLIKEKNISQLVIVDENDNFKGMVHFHDLIKEGLL